MEDGSGETAATGAPSTSPYRRVVRDSAVYGAGRMAGYMAGLLLMPVYTHALTVGEYGALENLTILTSLLATVLPLGLPNAVERYWFLAPTPAERRRTVGSGLAGILLMLSIALPILLLAAPITRRWLGSASYAPAFRLAVAMAVPAVLLSTVLSLLRALFRPGAFAVVSVTQIVLLASLNTWLVAGARMGIAGIFLGGALAAGGAVVLGGFFARGSLSLRADTKRLREMLAYGVPLVPAGLAFFTFSVVDRGVLMALKGAEPMGLYAAAVRVAGVIAFLTFAVNTAFVPLALQISDRPDARRIYSRCLTGFCCVAAWGALGLSALAREAIAILAPPEYAGGSRAVAPLAFGTALAGTAPFLTIGIHVLKRTWHIAWVAGVATGATALLCLALIPWFGLFGAAGATLLGNGILTLLYYLVGRRIYPVPIEGARLLRLALLAAGCVAAALLLNRAGAVFIAARLAIALAFPALLLVAGVLRVSEVRGVLAAFRRP